MSSSLALLKALSTPAIACEKRSSSPHRITFANDAAQALDDLEALLDELDFENEAQEVSWKGQRVLVDLRGVSGERLPTRPLSP
jgi:hypothetical protein